MTNRRIVLSPRELEVADLLVAGYTYKQVAQRMGLTVNTVACYVGRAADKIGGPSGALRQVRVIVWRAKQIGVVEHYAGLRDMHGESLVPPLPVESPLHMHHAAIFPR